MSIIRQESLFNLQDSVQRLKNDMMFRLDCGFLVSDNIPFKASYSRMFTQLSESYVP